MTTPTPAQQLEEVLAIYHVRFANAKAREEADAAIAAYDSAASEYLLEHAPVLRRALAALEAVEEYEFGVWQDDGLQASGHCADLDDARREAAHYAMMYGQDGPVEVRIYGKRLIPADAVEVSRD